MDNTMSMAGLSAINFSSNFNNNTAAAAGAAAAASNNEKELRLQLQARCADLEYQLAVRTDELKDVARERDRLKQDLEQSNRIGKARQEALDAMSMGAVNTSKSNINTTAGKTLREIQRASMTLGGGIGAAAASMDGTAAGAASDSAEEVFRLQSALIDATNAKAALEQDLHKAQSALKVIQETAISEVGKAKMDVEKEVITLRRQLEAAHSKNLEMKRSVMAADQILASEFQLEGMSQYVSHSILVPSETVFQRLRAEHRHSNGGGQYGGGGAGTNASMLASLLDGNNASTLNSSNKNTGQANGGSNTCMSAVGGVFQGKYDVSIEFSAATRSIILKGKRLCVELLKGEIYASLNSLTAAQVAAATGAPIAANGGFSRGSHQVLTTPGLGNRGTSGRLIGGSVATDPAAEIEHLCRTISTHEATIAALHTAIQHAQDRSKQCDSKAEEAQLHISFVEEKMKQAQILCTAKEKEFNNESSSLRAQLKFAEDKVEKALQSLQDEAAVSSHYRDENDKLREELEQVLASKEMSDRTGYVAAEQLKVLSIRADEAMKTASLAIADKEHSERLQKEIARVRADSEKKSDKMSQEIGQLQFQLSEREKVVADTQGRFKDLEIAVETANTEIEVQRELINELRNRLLLALNAGPGGVGSSGGLNSRQQQQQQQQRSGSSSMPILSNMSNAELLQKLSVPVLGGSDNTNTTTVHSSSADGGLNLTPRAGAVTAANSGRSMNPSATVNTSNILAFGASVGSSHSNASTRAHQANNNNNNNNNNPSSPNMINNNTTTTMGGVGGALSSTAAAMVTPLPNDALTMQIIEDLYVENDALKAEIVQAHKDIREVAHALKETREVREQAIREVEKLQMEKSKWSEERITAQRVKMEEQLMQRQRAAEHELALAQVRDELQQYKARCDVLQRKMASQAASTVGLTMGTAHNASTVGGGDGGNGMGVGGGSTPTTPRHGGGNGQQRSASAASAGVGGTSSAAHSPNTLAAVASARLAALAGGDVNNAVNTNNHRSAAGAASAVEPRSPIGGTRSAAMLSNSDFDAAAAFAKMQQQQHVGGGVSLLASSSSGGGAQQQQPYTRNAAVAAAVAAARRDGALTPTASSTAAAGGYHAAATNNNTTAGASGAAANSSRRGSVMSSLMASPPASASNAGRSSVASGGVTATSSMVGGGGFLSEGLYHHQTGGGGGGNHYNHYYGGGMGGAAASGEPSMEQPNSYARAPVPTPSPSLSRYLGK